jgi:Mn-containing catalase
MKPFCDLIANIAAQEYGHIELVSHTISRPSLRSSDAVFALGLLQRDAVQVALRCAARERVRIWRRNTVPEFL